jgi:6-phosphogluconate dehydrogenase
MAAVNDIGLFGLAVMGQNFALNMAEHGFKVGVHNRTLSKVDDTVARAKAENVNTLTGYHDTKEFVMSLKKPRAIVILVVAGPAVDKTIANLSQYMEAGDVIIDGGNEWYPNSLRRAEELAPKNILFMGMGISGGEEGARKGPSIMPGGPKAGWDIVAPIMEKSAAQVDDGPCTFYIGEIGSGNYVKMIHNGIEYGDMQLIAETYDALKNIGGMSNPELGATFDAWNKTELASYLIEITAIILKTKDSDIAGGVNGDGYIVDKILDKTGMKGTGRWTIQEAAERSVVGSVMAAALDSRYVSGRKEERQAAEKILTGPAISGVSDKAAFVEDVRAALFAAKIISYAQGLCLIKEAGNQLGWDIDLGECARIWKGGCIIRAQFLDSISKAFRGNPALPNLLVDPTFAEEIKSRQGALRRVVSVCALNGVPCPAMSAALNYYDSYRRGSLPANLTQAQRDFFGGHSFERTDKDGAFHMEWTDAHKSIGDVSARTETYDSKAPKSRL